MFSRQIHTIFFYSPITFFLSQQIIFLYFRLFIRAICGSKWAHSQYSPGLILSYIKSARSPQAPSLIFFFFLKAISDARNQQQAQHLLPLASRARVRLLPSPTPSRRHGELTHLNSALAKFLPARGGKGTAARIDAGGRRRPNPSVRDGISTLERLPGGA
jgi:hypothetical protein